MNAGQLTDRCGSQKNLKDAVLPIDQVLISIKGPFRQAIHDLSKSIFLGRRERFTPFRA
jgi:hypothetical protein